MQQYVELPLSLYLGNWMHTLLVLIRYQVLYWKVTMAAHPAAAYVQQGVQVHVESAVGDTWLPRRRGVGLRKRGTYP